MSDALLRRIFHTPLLSGTSRRAVPGTGRRLLAVALGLIGVNAAALDPAKSVYQYNIRNWTRQEGLPGNKINAIAQSPDGYLWIGTQNGLVRFDGMKFTTVPIDLPQVRGKDVRTLVPARAGGVWFAIEEGGFGRFDGKSFSGIADRRWNSAGTRASTILESREGQVWTGTAQALGRWFPDRPGESSLDATATRILGLCEDPSGSIWIGTQYEGLLRWSEGRVSRIDNPVFAKHASSALAADRRGRIWIATERGLLRYDPASGEIWLDSTCQPVISVLVDRHEVVWAGSPHGLVRVRGDTVSVLGKADGLGSDYIAALCEDAEGSIWIGSQDGLSQLSDVKFPIYSAKEGLTDGSGLAVAASHRGGLWICTTSGFNYFDGQKITRYSDPALLPNPYVKLGLEARNGDFYWVDGDRNISVLRDGKLAARYASAEWPEALVEDDQGVIAAIGATLVRITEHGLKPLEFKGPPPEFTWIENLALGHDGALLVACYNGLFRIHNGEYQHWSTAEGLSGNRVHYVLEDSDGSIWAGISTGLARIRGAQVRNLSEANGLFDDRTYAIVPDNLGYFWISSGRGIYRVARQALNDFADGRAGSVAYEPFDGEESIKFTDRVDQEYSGCRTQDGRIWFPNFWGAAMIDPSNYVVNCVAPPVYLERIKVHGSEVAAPGSGVLIVADEQVEFFFAAPSFVSPRRMAVRYQLEGYDRHWVDAGTNRSAQYRLKPGQYTFRVQAANADGIWNTAGASVALELPPPFYQRLWFFGLVAFGASGLLFGAYRLKVRQLRRRQHELQALNDRLEAKVAKRTQELASERDLLRRLLDGSPDQIYFKDNSSRFLKVSAALARNAGVKSPDELVGKTDSDLFTAAHASRAMDNEREIIRTGQPLIGAIERETWGDGRETWVLTSKMPLRDDTGKIVGTMGISQDITALKQAEARLDELHKQLVTTSREAGMAEVATSVLHNVGNVLNSVNVSATMVADQLRASRVMHLSRVSSLLQQHAADLGAFLTTDPKGQKVPEFLSLLSGELLAEHESNTAEIDRLRRDLDHIKEIVAMQQSYAKVVGVVEKVELVEVVEDAIRINSSALTRHQVELIRDYAAKPVLSLERHKVVQILVNLIRNAKYACDESQRMDKKLTIRITEDPKIVTIAIIDNGVGIPPENLTRIFSHGFTTRKEGHGFGLHSGSLVARELGGSLTAYSEGTGHGARFELRLPWQQPSPDQVPPAS